MTLVEVLIALAIFAAVMIAVGTFEANTFLYQSNISGSYQTAENAQIILKTMLTELREMAPGADGSYALVNAGSTTIAFFSDADNDGTEEELSYSLIGTTLYRTMIKPSGSPPAYNLSSQSTTTLMTSIRNNGSTPVFQYFDAAYSGTSTPLSQPVTTTAVRLVKVSLTLDLDPNRSPTPVTYSVQAGLRNLKTNL